MSWTCLPNELKRAVLEQLPWRVRWQVLRADRALFYTLDRDALDGFVRLLAEAPSRTAYRMTHGWRTWRVLKLEDGWWTHRMIGQRDEEEKCLLSDIEEAVRSAFSGVGRRYRVWVHGPASGPPQAF